MAMATRRRGAELEQAIFEAVWAELAEVGYARLTMEGVAARAQTGKQVLYRRWPSRAELVQAAMRARSGSILERVPDTGSLRTDVLMVLTHMVQRQRDLGVEVMRGLLFDTAEFEPASLAEVRGIYLTMLEHAAARGEIGPAPVPLSVVEVPGNLMRYRLLVDPEPVTDTELERIADEIFLPLVRAHAGAAR